MVCVTSALVADGLAADTAFVILGASSPSINTVIAEFDKLDVTLLLYLIFTPFTVCVLFAFAFTTILNVLFAVFSELETFVHSGLYIGVMVLPVETAIAPSAVLVSPLLVLNDVLFL